jgi:hypothetical protein
LRAGGLPQSRHDEETALCAAVFAAYSRDELERFIDQWIADSGPGSADVVLAKGYLDDARRRLAD